MVKNMKRYMKVRIIVNLLILVAPHILPQTKNKNMTTRTENVPIRIFIDQLATIP